MTLFKTMKPSTFAISFLTVLATSSLLLGLSRSATAKPAIPMMPHTISAPSPASAQPTSSSRNRIVRIGSQGQSVKDAQSALKKAGFDPGAIDGIFGRQTQAAVMKFQQSKKLAADGVVGAKTWTALPH